MQDNPEIRTPSVYAAIAAVMNEMRQEGIGKTRKNTQQGYNFRGIDDVYNALSGPMARAGLVMLPRVLDRSVTERQTAKGGALFYVVVDVEFDLVAASDASKHTVRVQGEAMDSADKATNKAMSAAFKYAAIQAFCIPTEGDNDADSTHHEVEAAQPPSDALMAEATKAADAGTDAFRAWWKGIDQRTRAAISPYLDDFKARASKDEA